ncbi:MAG: endonuclease/exonuclease/phosphatase family protein [Bacteroidales bacterium]|nr:endonuclease/exonuclease/phosphatase family protein [Bacteroidales bacterium]
MKATRNLLMAGMAAILVLSCGTKSTNEPIRFANYNMREILAVDTADRAFYKRLPLIVKRITDYDFDIIGTQEVTYEMRSALFEVLGDTYGIFGSGRKNYSNGEGTPIMYKRDRFDLLNKGNFWLSETPDVPGSVSWDCSQERLATWGIFLDKKTGKKFLYINTHFDHRGPISRAKAAELLLQKARELGGGLPAFFSGDFNATVSSDELAVLSDNDLVKDSYASSVTEPTGRVGSYYGFDFDMPDDENRIDYIFVPKSATVHSYACIDDDFRDRQYSSDHCPLLVVVSLN